MSIIAIKADNSKYLDLFFFHLKHQEGFITLEEEPPSLRGKRFICINRIGKVSFPMENSLKEKWCDTTYHLPRDTKKVFDIDPPSTKFNRFVGEYVLKEGNLLRIIAAEDWVSRKGQLDVEILNVETGQSRTAWLANMPPFLDADKISEELNKIAKKKFGRDDYLYHSQRDQLIDESLFGDSVIVYNKGNWKQPTKEVKIFVDGMKVFDRNMTTSQITKLINDKSALENINE